MAKTTDWSGTASGHEGEFAWAANWSNGVPVDGDTARFLSGRQSVTGDLDQSALDLAALIAENGYSGNWASSAAALQISAALLSYNGRGDAWLDTSSSSTNFDAVYMKGSAPNKRLYLTGPVSSLHAMKGNLTLQAGTLTEVFIEALSAQHDDPDIQIVNANITTLRQMSGIIVQNGSGIVTTGYFRAGKYTIDEGTITNVEGWGGLIVKNSPTTLADLKMYAGRCDLSQDDRAKAVTDCEIHYGAFIDAINGPDNVTFTNPVKRIGGEINARTLTTTGL